MQYFTFTELSATISFSVQYNKGVEINISTNFFRPERSYSSYKQIETLTERHDVIWYQRHDCEI